MLSGSVWWTIAGGTDELNQEPVEDQQPSNGARKSITSSGRSSKVEFQHDTVGTVWNFIAPLKTDSALAQVSQRVFDKEHKYYANDTEPLPIAICRAKGVFMWDVEGHRYYDFFAADSSVNQGHCHPKIIKSLADQAELLTIISRDFYSDVLGEFSQYVTEMFHYDKVLALNTDVEAVETACHLARKWGCETKNIVKNQTKIVVANGNFWNGKIFGFSNLDDGFNLVDYNNLEELEKTLSDPNVCGFMVEPIQSTAEITIPDEGYLRGIQELCAKHNVLWIGDEINTGLGRTGRLLACDFENVRPDILILGKSLSGGVHPVSVVLANNEVMQYARSEDIRSGTSTFNANPLGLRCTMAALDVLKEEFLTENADKVGAIAREELESLPKEIVEEIQGKGLLINIILQKEYDARDICIQLKNHGLLAKPMKKIIRLTPPLCVTEDQIQKSFYIVQNVLHSILAEKNKEKELLNNQNVTTIENEILENTELESEQETSETIETEAQIETITEEPDDKEDIEESCCQKEIQEKDEKVKAEMKNDEENDEINQVKEEKIEKKNEEKNKEKKEHETDDLEEKDVCDTKM